MNPDDWCPLHGADGDVCDCRVEPEPTLLGGAGGKSIYGPEPVPRPVSGYFLLSNAISESRWQRNEEEGTHVISDVSEPVPRPIYEEWV